MLFPPSYVLKLLNGSIHFFTAGDAALTPLMLVEILSYNRLNSSVGFMCMFRGVTILIAGPIGGKYSIYTSQTFFDTFFCLILNFILWDDQKKNRESRIFKTWTSDTVLQF